MYRLIFYYLLIFPSIVYSQNSIISEIDSTRISIARDFLKERLGEDFVRDSLQISGSFLSVLPMIAFEIKLEYATDRNKNMILVFVDGDSVETKFNTKINRTDIDKYLKGNESDNIFYNKKFAMNLASQNNFEKGIKGWEIEISGIAKNVYWAIRSYDSEEHEPVYGATGKSYLVNIRNGETKIKEWIIIE